MAEEQTQETKEKKEINLEDLAFTQIAQDPACQHIITYLEIEKESILANMGEMLVRRDPNLMLGYAGELKFCDDLLNKIYSKMHESEVATRKKESGRWTGAIGRFFKKLLTAKKKELNG